MNVSLRADYIGSFLGPADLLEARQNANPEELFASGRLVARACIGGSPRNSELA
jgi:hypothetical protein